MSSLPPPAPLMFEPIGPRRFRLSIDGELPLGWSAIVAANLTKLGCDVEHAQASLDDRGGWTGVFEGTRPLGFLGVTAEELLFDAMGSAPSVVPNLVTHSIMRDSTNGRLEVHVRAHDASGLLAAFLRHFGMLGLFPHSFEVRTDRGHADDRFTLAGIAGSRASERSEREFARLLERWSNRAAPAHARQA